MGFGSDKTGFYKPIAVTVTASGNPLTLQNAKRLRKLTIYGNAVQDGTPSPDAPVEVQLCGDKTRNLLSMIDANPNTIPVKSYSNGIIEVIGEASLSGGRTNRLSDYIILESNQTYTMVSYLVAGQTDSDIYVCLSRREDGTIYKSIGISAEKRSITIAPDENVELYLGINVTTGNRNSTLRVAIYKGSYTADTLPAYEPYGYKVSGRVEGLNLFKQTGNTYSTNGLNTVAEYQEYIINGTTEAIFNLYLEKNINLNIAAGEPITLVTEILDGEIIYPENSVIYFTLFNSDNTAYIRYERIRKPQKGLIRATGNLPSTNSGYNIIIQCLKEKGIVFNNVRIRLTVLKGTYTAETLPPYEPYQPPQDFAVYLPEQIAKVGDVADEVVVDMESKTAELRKNVGSVVADGDEDWLRGGKQYDTADYTNRYSNFYDIRGNSETPGYFSNRFERKLGGMWNNPNSEAFNINNNQLHLSISNTRLGITADDEASDRTTKFKAWLNDNNVTVYAPLATPVTTDITSLQQWDAMPQVSGTVTLTLSAEVVPSGAEAVYTATKRPKAQAALIEENTIPEEPAETQVSDADINTEIIMMED